MDLPALEQVLLALAARCGVAVRHEPFDRSWWGDFSLRGGGFCVLHGDPVLVLDAALPPADRVALLVDTLSRFDLEPIAMPPVVRELIARQEQRRRSESRPRPRRRLRLVGRVP